MISNDPTTVIAGMYDGAPMCLECLNDVDTTAFDFEAHGAVYFADDESLIDSLDGSACHCGASFSKTEGWIDSDSS